MPEPNPKPSLDRPEGTTQAEHAKQLARGAVADLRADDATPVEVRLGMLSLLARHVERNIDDLVQEARRRRVSWQQIADLVGITRQGVQKRYGRHPSAPDVARGDADEVVGSFHRQRRQLAALTPEQRQAEVDQLAGLLERLPPQDRANVMQKLESRRRIIRSLGVSESGDEVEAALVGSTVRVVRRRRRRRAG
jgi:hypothetical protein